MRTSSKDSEGALTDKLSSNRRIKDVKGAVLHHVGIIMDVTLTLMQPSELSGGAADGGKFVSKLVAFCLQLARIGATSS